MRGLYSLISTASLIVITLNLSFWGIGLLVLGLLKAGLPTTREWADARMDSAYRGAVAVNDAWLRGVLGLEWDLPEIAVARDEICIVVSNHASWADILLVQSVLVRQGPLLKFLTKRELLFIPVLGVIFWAFDFPLLRRRARGSINDEARRAADAEALSSACEAVRVRPAALMNFAEGTRLTNEKRLASESPYRHLLAPRVGGFAALVEALGDDLVSVVDVSLIYSESTSFWTFISGRAGPIGIEIERIPAADVPRDREALSGWLAELWRRKDERIDRVRTGRSF